MTNSTGAISRPLTVLILTELIIVAAAAAWHRFDPIHDLNYLLIIWPVVCLEGLYSGRLIRNQNLYSWDIPKFRAVELIALVVLVKLSAALSNGNFAANLVTLDVRTALGAVLSVVLWLSMLDTAQDFRRIDEPPPPVMNNPGDYVSPLARLTIRYFGGGVVMLVAVAVLSTAPGSIASLIPVVLAYFVLGLLLMPQLRFQMSRQRWDSLGIPNSNRMVSSWIRAGLVLVGLAVVVAVLLPTNYLSGLLEFFRAAFLVIANLLIFVVTLAWWLVTLPLRLLAGTSTAPDNAPPVMPRLPPMTPPATAAPNQLLDLLPKILLLAVVGYIVITYFRDHPELWAMVKRLQLVKVLGSLWLALRRGVSSVAQGVTLRLPSALPALFRRNRGARQPFRFIRLGALSAREQVLYFYLSVLRRADDQGISRGPMQTPFEYGETLKPNLPQSQEEMDQLTAAFVEARYSLHPVETTQAKHVESSWKRVKQAIRNIRKP